jgi:hypothetical protein
MVQFSNKPPVNLKKTHKLQPKQMLFNSYSRNDILYFFL